MMLSNSLFQEIIKNWSLINPLRSESMHVVIEKKSCKKHSKRMSKKNLKLVIFVLRDGTCQTRIGPS